MAVKKDPRTLEVAEPFVSLFPIQPEVLGLVKESMREHGFQDDKPILLWNDAFGERGRQVVIGGHTRLQGALDVKLPEVWTTVRQFKDVDAAIAAAIGDEVIRRNLNREQIAAYVISILPLLDKTNGGLRTRTATELAHMLGVSKPTVDRTRSLLNSGRSDLVDAVKQGEMSLLAAWQESLDEPMLPEPEPAAEEPPPADIAPAEEPPVDHAAPEERGVPDGPATGATLSTARQRHLGFVRSHDRQASGHLKALRELLIGAVVRGESAKGMDEVVIEVEDLFVFMVVELAAVSGRTESGDEEEVCVVDIKEILRLPPAPATVLEGDDDD